MRGHWNSRIEVLRYLGRVTARRHFHSHQGGCLSHHLCSRYVKYESTTLKERIAILTLLHSGMVPMPGCLDERISASQMTISFLPFYVCLLNKLVRMEGSTFFEVAPPRTERSM